MKKVSSFIVNKRKYVFLVFLLAVAISIYLQFFVDVNADLSKYLPENASSTIGLDVMKREFKEELPNLRIYIENVSVIQAKNYKEKLLNEKEVKSILWIDDIYDIKKPISFANKEILDNYYKDGNALFQLVVNSENPQEYIKKLRDYFSHNIAFEGQFVDLAQSQSSVSSEIIMIVIIIVPLGLLILMFATHSWIEPFLLLVAIGVAVILNMGTNIIIGEVSFITQAVMAVLQLAVSMDYAIFLLDRFNQNRKDGYEIEEAMEMAIVKSSTAIISSAMTTILGFLSLIFMQFRLGSDLGIVLAKGVVFSLISVLFFLPVIIILSSNWIEKTTHRSFLPSFKRIGKIVYKIRYIVLLVILIAVPVFLAQKNNDFIYGMGEYPKGSIQDIERNLINDKFGSNIQMALLVPKADLASEVSLHKDLRKIKRISSIMSYIENIGAVVPDSILDKTIISGFLSENYSRIILNVDSKKEGEEAFKTVERIRAIANKYYGDKYHLIGESVINLDMKDTIQRDNLIVNGLAIFSVGFVILLAFKSITIPLILLLTIEISIWINLSIPYFSSISLTYIGYLVISTVQLGATVDYAILFTQEYLDNRKFKDKKSSIMDTVRNGLRSILPPAAILVAAGYILKYISSLRVVSELGEILGRGAALSFTMVVFLLPSLLYFLDPIIEKTSLKVNFKKKGAKNDKNI